MARKSKGNKCFDCGKPISDAAKRCRSCAHKKPEIEAVTPTLLAWRYSCYCGITAYSFDPVPFIVDTKGHEVQRGPKVIYGEGKSYDYCPLCGLAAYLHTGKRNGEMFYLALCPTKG